MIYSHVTPKIFGSSLPDLLSKSETNSVFWSFTFYSFSLSLGKGDGLQLRKQKRKVRSFIMKLIFHSNSFYNLLPILFTILVNNALIYLYRRSQITLVYSHFLFPNFHCKCGRWPWFAKQTREIKFPNWNRTTSFWLLWN